MWRRHNVDTETARAVVDTARTYGRPRDKTAIVSIIAEKKQHQECQRQGRIYP